MKKGMKKRMGCKADGEVKYRSNLMVVRILTRRPTKQTAFYSPFPARCFSQAGKSILTTAFSFPAEFLVGKGGVGPDCHSVTCTARSELVIELEIVDFLECLYKLED